jgi:polar amino acid transport system substrate-binding protein
VNSSPDCRNFRELETIMIPRRTLLSLLVGALSAASLPALAQQSPFDLGPEQPGRIRADEDPAAIAAS